VCFHTLKIKKDTSPQRKPPPIAPRRTPTSKGIASSSGRDGGNQEYEGENEDQRKKRKEMKIKIILRDRWLQLLILNPDTILT